VAGDSTGLESRHVSRYYSFRTGRRRSWYRWPKLSAVCDCATHLLLSGQVTHGPSSDFAEGAPILKDAWRRTAFERALLDAGFDSEANHVLIREELGAQSIIPARSGRPSKSKPPSRYRQLMRTHFPRKLYGQRWQIESVFSRHKRLLGSALRATSWKNQKREILLRLLVHNLMILPPLYLFDRATL
jgi:transposase